MDHSICHVEFQVVDLARAQNFFEQLFGWSFRSFGDEMSVFGIGDTHIGGLQRVAKVVPGESPSVWFRVADLDSMVAKTRSLGGTVPYEKHPVPGVGFSQAILDLDGNAIGLVQYFESGTEG